MFVIKPDLNTAQVNVFHDTDLCFSSSSHNIYLSCVEAINFLLDNQCYDFLASGFSTTQEDFLKCSFVKSQHFIDTTDKNKVFFEKNKQLMLQSFYKSKKTQKNCQDVLSYLLSVMEKITINKTILLQQKPQESLMIDLMSNLKNQFKEDKKLREQLSEFNLFCDGSVKEKIGKTKIGGYIATKKDIVKTFSQNLDNKRYHDVNETEMYAIYHGLCLAKELNISQIKVFSDSSVAIEKIALFLQGQKINEKYTQVLSLIENKIQGLNIQFHHITRRYNKYADYLTQ